MTALSDRLARAVESVRAAGFLQGAATGAAATGPGAGPAIGLILGSGLGGLADAVDKTAEAPFADIKGLTPATAPGHAGSVIAGTLSGRPLIVCQGRVHLYEGASALDVAMPVYLLGRLGVKTLIVTNAAGGLNPAFEPGDVMAIADHINLTGANPTLGEENPGIGPRFVDMSRAYDVRARELAHQSAKAAGLALQEGIYAGVLGPSLETSAERRYYHKMGADAVGMSTVLEVIAANHCGMNVLGLSAITNKADGGPDQQPDTIEDVLAHAAVAGEKIAAIIKGVVSQIAQGDGS